jgi:sigma-B regulation protein RsbU (phosphoserine phosphatase)
MRNNTLLELLAPVAAQLTTDLAECLTSRWALAFSNFAHGLEVIYQYGDHSDAERCAALTQGLLSKPAGANSPAVMDLQQSDTWAPCIICPIRVHKDCDLLAVLVFGPKVAGDAYTISDADLIRHFAAHLSFVMSDDRLAAKFGARIARLRTTELEMENARLVRERFLPTRLPRINGLDFYGESWPSSRVGGDFFDFIANDDSSLLAAIGDVSGRDVPAAIVMAGVQASLRALGPSNGRDLSGLVRNLNNSIWQLAPDHFYTTMFCARIDSIRREMVYVNAGHDRAVLLRDGARHAVTLCSTGTVLGLSTRSEFRQAAIPFEPGDILIAVTDGVTDAADVPDWIFEKVLLDIACHYGNEPSSDLAARIMAATETIGPGQTTADDKTVVVVRFVQAEARTTITKEVAEGAVLAAA